MLSYNFIGNYTDTLSNVLERNPQLTDLNVSWNKFYALSDLCNTLQTFPNIKLKSLNLSWNLFANHDCVSISNILQNNPQLQILYLQGNNLSYDGYVKFFDDICYLSGLYLDYNQFMDSVACELLLESQSFYNLTVLSLRSNPIGSEGFKYISKILMNPNNSLISLDVNNTKMGDDGCKYLFQNLGKLQKLHAASNNLTNIAFECIAQCLMNNSELLDINLSYNPILSNEAFEFLNSIIINNSSLMVIDMAYTMPYHFTCVHSHPEYYEILSENLEKYNTTLLSLELTSCVFEPSIMKINQYLKRNREIRAREIAILLYWCDFYEEEVEE